MDDHKMKGANFNTYSVACLIFTYPSSPTKSPSLVYPLCQAMLTSATLPRPPELLFFWVYPSCWAVSSLANSPRDLFVADGHKKSLRSRKVDASVLYCCCSRHKPVYFLLSSLSLPFLSAFIFSRLPCINLLSTSSLLVHFCFSYLPRVYRFCSPCPLSSVPSFSW